MQKSNMILCATRMLLTAVSLCLMSALASAQNSTAVRPSISAGYGIGSAPQIVEAFSDFFTFGVTGGNFESRNAKFSGALVGNFKIPVGHAITLGADVVYESFTKDVFVNNTFRSKADGRYITIMPRGDYYWLRRDGFRMYSGLALGASFASQEYEGDKQTNTAFAFQVSPIGVEAGRGLCFFGEAGFGFNGILHGGLRVRF